MNSVNPKLVKEAVMKRTFFVIIILSLLLAGCSSAEKGAAPTPESGGTKDFGAVISATGVVVPEQWAALSARSQAVVVEVLVTEGEQVSAGQLLVRLDGQAAAQANLSASQYELINAQQALATLKENAATERARAQKAVADAMQAVHDAQDDADSLYYPRASETRIKNTQAEIDLSKKALARAQDSWRLVARLEDGNERKAEALAAMTEAQLYLNDLSAKYNWYVGKPTDIDAA
jgi:multidrug efflux pump subunit AcrA (membrane-fusion protein)